MYANALVRHEQGERTISIDEKTGIQALERAGPELEMKPGMPQKQEFEYIRHGTQALLGSMDVATGEIFAVVGASRTEDDLARMLEQLFASDPQAKCWHVVADNLNTHVSESVVRLTARLSGIDEQVLGMKNESGVLKSMKTRQNFLKDPSHKVVWYFTPKHASWLNQIEIWFSILVRKVIRRGNFVSTDDLKEKLLAFIEYFNRTMARPFRWTYQGKPLLS